MTSPVCAARQMIRPRLTTIAQPFQEMSRIAVRALTEDDGIAAQQARHFVVPGTLIVRDSSGPCRQS